MPSCPRCIHGGLFYDRSAREWWCINCGYHRCANGSHSISLSPEAENHNGARTPGNVGNGKTEFERTWGPALNSISSTLSLDEEIAELRRKLRGYESQKKVLMNLMRHGVITRDYLMQELNQLDVEREEREKELNRLTQIRDSWRSVLKIK